MAGRIRDEDIALVREKSPIDEVVGEYLQLRNAGGGSLKGLCPFHDENSPSFNVTPARGLFYCFGCGEGGDAISFVRQIDGLTLRRGGRAAGGRAGIELRYEQGGYAPAPGAGQRRRLIEAHKAAAAYYAEQLVRPDAGTAAVPRRARLRAGRARLRRRLRAQRVGRPHQAPARPGLHRCGAGHGRPGQGGQRGSIDRFHGRLIGRSATSRRRGRLRRAQARPGRRRAEYLNTPRPRCSRSPRALRRRPGQARDRAAAAGRHRRGLHRRDGVPPGGRADGGRHLRHLVRRGPYQGAAPADAWTPTARQAR